jgi:hypothetical protein
MPHWTHQSPERLYGQGRRYPSACIRCFGTPNSLRTYAESARVVAVPQAIRPRGFAAGPVVTLPGVDLPDVYIPEETAQLAFLRREVAFPV